MRVRGVLAAAVIVAAAQTAVASPSPFDAPAPAPAAVATLPGWNGLGFGARVGNLTVAFARNGAASIDASGKVQMYVRVAGADQWIGRTIYDSPADDRNVAGGVTPSGRLVVFFARLDVARNRWLDMGSIWSDDLGRTWSAYRPLPLRGDRWYSPYGSLVALPSGKLMQLVYGTDERGTGHVRAFFSSDDGRTWGHPRIVLSLRGEVQPSETAAVVAGGTKDSNTTIVAVARTGPWAWRRGSAGGLVQAVSDDGGATWRSLGRIHLAASSQDVSPWLARSGASSLSLVWVDRTTMTIESSSAGIADALRSSLAWSKPVVVASHRIPVAGSSATVDFGYPSIVPATSIEPMQIVYYDVPPVNASPSKDSDPSFTHLVTVALQPVRVAATP